MTYGRIAMRAVPWLVVTVLVSVAFPYAWMELLRWS